jgi:hypothetical protein
VGTIVGEMITGTGVAVVTTVGIEVGDTLAAAATTAVDTESIVGAMTDGVSSTAVGLTITIGVF